MKKKIKDLKLWDIYFFNRQKVVCVGRYGGCPYYTKLNKFDWAVTHWESDLDKKVTILGKMREGQTDEEIEQERIEIGESYKKWCEERGQWP